MRENVKKTTTNYAKIEKTKKCLKKQDSPTFASLGKNQQRHYPI